MKVLCAALAGPGHTYPMLAVAEALASRGHEVTLASGPEHIADAEGIGAQGMVLPIHDGSPIDALRPYDDSENLARAFAPIVASLRPDVVVADLLTLGAGLAAEMNGVPWASLLVHGLHTWAPDVLPFGWGQPPAGWLLRWRDRQMMRAHRRTIEAARDDLNRIRAALGLTPTDRLDGQLSPSLQLVATLPSLEIARADWPRAAHVIGPCLWEGDAEVLPPPPGDAECILIAPSTARDGTALVHAALDVVRRLGLRAIVTGDVEGSLPDGVVAARAASHDAAMEHVDAVVGNGGHGTVVRALTHGRPVVVLPAHGDQRENGYRVERIGAGLRVMRPSRLAPAIVRVLANPRFAEGARRAAAEAAGMDGPGTAADLVEALVAGVVPAGKPPGAVDVEKR